MQFAAHIGVNCTHPLDLPLIAAVVAADANPRGERASSGQPNYPVGTGATLIRTGPVPDRKVRRARVKWGSTAEA